MILVRLNKNEVDKNLAQSLKASIEEAKAKHKTKIDTVFCSMKHIFPSQRPKLAYFPNYSKIQQSFKKDSSLYQKCRLRQKELINWSTINYREFLQKSKLNKLSQNKKLREYLEKVNQNSGQNVFANYLLQYAFVRNTSWINKMVRSKFFYYILIYKIVMFAAKIGFLIYFFTK